MVNFICTRGVGAEGRGRNIETSGKPLSNCLVVCKSGVCSGWDVTSSGVGTLKLRGANGFLLDGSEEEAFWDGLRILEYII
ncbi:hypothetical protein IQ243_11210 [Nostocales cyanobacterium LEGE 11386]|jgi:hypothetical protein|nr:hypothetical protein [Nostocales cyanobacterium LEGE 11386]MBW4558905.1 hypothetical protein [Trichormus sp. ATA11-4-KO1]